MILVSRRLLVLAIGVCMVLTSCSQRSGGDHARLVIALGSDVSTLDPHMTANVAVDLSVLSHIYPALIVRDPDLQLRPSVAERWTLVSPQRWRFVLTPDARFENGEPIDAEAVRWNLTRVRDPAKGARIRQWFAAIEDVEIVDARTVDIVTSRPYPALPAQLSMLLLLPPRWAATHDVARTTQSGGAYRLVEHVSGDHVTLRRNPTYWGAPARFDTVEFRTIPSATARVASVLAGEVDLVTALPVPEMRRLAEDGRVVAGAVPSVRSVFIKLNTLRPPLNDARVRQALNLAIDKTALSQSLFGGAAPVSACQLLTPAYAGFNPALRPYGYDPKTARALLKAAGAQGAHLTLETPSNNALQGGEITQAIAAQLENVGLKIRQVQLDNAYYMDKFVKGGALGDLSLLSYAWPTLDADGILSLFESRSPYAYYRDPSLDAALPLARATLDKVEQNRRYAEITERMCRQAPVVFLFAQPATYATSRRIHWRARGDDWVRAADVEPAAHR